MACNQNKLSPQSHTLPMTKNLEIEVTVEELSGKLPRCGVQGTINIPCRSPDSRSTAFVTTS